MVVVIMAIVAGSALALLNAQQSSARVSATKTKQEALQQALINFIAKNSRLPCPAVPTAAQAAANYGVEAPTPGTCTGTTVIGGGTTTTVRGVIPWVTLGLSDDAALDGYGRRFTYQVVRTETNKTAATITSLRGTMNVRRAAGGTLINNGNPATVLIVSHGANGWGAYLPLTGTRMTLPTGADESENTNTDIEFVQKDHSNTTANTFDDLVKWLTPGDLLAPLTNAGQLKTVNGEIVDRIQRIRSALLGAITKDTVNHTPPAPGGGNTVPATLGLPTSITVDPWAANVNYTRGFTNQLRLSTAVATNYAFRIWSYGANGVSNVTFSGNTCTVTAAGDDISYCMTIGELIGLLGTSVPP